MTSTAPREWVVDAVLAAALAAFALTSVLTDHPEVTYDLAPANAWAVLFALLASAPLAVRRRWPLAVAVAVSVGSTALGLGGWYVGAGGVCTFFALYAAAAWNTLRRAVAGLLAGYAGLGMMATLGGPDYRHPLALVAVAGSTVAWAAGMVMRQRRQARAEAEAAAVKAEARRAVAAERAVFDERLRIARELHDVVTHSLSDVAVQAGVARFAGTEDPVAMTGALAAIERSSRTALDDLRRMLGLLRAPVPPGAGAPVEPAAASPGPGVRESIIDIVVTLALATYGVVGAFTVDPSVTEAFPPATPGVVILILVGTLPLAVRRRWPVTVFLAALASTALVEGIGTYSDLPGIAALVAGYTVAAWRPLRVSMAVLAVGLMSTTVNVLREGFAPIDLVGEELVPVAVAFGLGLIARRWRQARSDALARAAAAERERAVLAEQAVLAERLRVARDLHDVVAHALSLIAVQAGVARYSDTPTTDPQAARDALAAVEEASRRALCDLRAMLAALDPNAEQASLQPSPRLSDLERLAASGTVAFDIDPAAMAAPPSLQLTVYRLVQEALTNARKYSPGSAVTVHIGITNGEVTVRVDDDGHTTRTGTIGAGMGLVGMRERVALFGGAIDAGPKPEGGFRVEARLRQAGAPA